MTPTALFEFAMDTARAVFPPPQPSVLVYQSAGGLAALVDHLPETTTHADQRVAAIQALHNVEPDAEVLESAPSGSTAFYLWFVRR